MTTAHRTTTGQTVRTGLVGLLATGLAVTAFAVPARADSAPRPGGHQATQQALDAIVKGGTPGVIAQTRDANGVWNGRAGVGDRETGEPRNANDRFRIGSITKTFVATVLLQMEAERKLDLDDSVEKWLPGLVRGNGNDGRAVTVRQLLNHTSGIYNYTNDPQFQANRLVGEGFLRNRFQRMEPEGLVKVAMGHRPDFAPGARHSYSNTGYILAGLIIEKVSGNSYEHEVRDRIVKPLGLRATTLPKHRVQLPEPSSRAYSTVFRDPQQGTYDVTEQNTTWGWSAGDMVSTTGDLNRFMSALIRGKLLPKAQLTAMKTTVPDPDVPGGGYGLGIGHTTTSCGVKVWGHNGGLHGSLSDAVTTEDGRHSLAANQNGDWIVSANVLDAEFCGTVKPRSELQRKVLAR